MENTNHTPSRRLLRGILAAGIVIGAAAPALAQGFVSPLIGYGFGGDTGCPNLSNCEDKKIQFSVSAGSMGNVIGIEEEFGYAPNFFGDSPALSSSVLTLMTNLMIVPKIGPVRPYVLAGIGLMKTHVEFTAASLLTTNDNSLGWDLGGGLMGLLSSHVGLRGDLRYFHSFQDLTVLGFTLGNSKLDYGRASVGLVFAF